MKGLTIIVKKITQIMAGIVFLYGVYIIIHGHLTPGGGFAGGTIVAGSFILLIIANGIPLFNLKKKKEQSSLIESIAILGFLLLALVGLVLTTRVFFKNFLPEGIPGNLVSAGTIPVYNIVVGIEVAAALISVFMAFIIFKAED